MMSGRVASRRCSQVGTIVCEERDYLAAMGIDRRQFLTAAAGAVGGVAMSTLPGWAAQAADGATSCPGAITDIDHVVILIQENRSFDHYFGTYPGVRGFADRRAIPGVFEQPFVKNTSVAPLGRVLPYHLDTSLHGAGECTPDPGHGWAPQHQAWNGGAMNAWGAAHAGDADWSFMGYYTRGDLPYLHAVADAFTLCDGYHCSVLGPTTPNRLYSVSGWIDPTGKAGGPVTGTISWNPRSTPYSWETYPERLTAAGVSWIAYSSPDADSEENPLVDFKQFYPGNAGYKPAYTEAVFGRTYVQFLADAAAGQLPQVSWVLTSIVEDEHPAAPPQAGQFALQEVIAALTANTAAWKKTALFWTYDENGGFFDHIAPPTPVAGRASTVGEFIGATPIGLGFRVPMLVVSPFSQGGFVCRDTFDHTSLLRFLERRFGVEVPFLTPWRRSVTGDLTAAFNFARPRFAPPRIAPATPWNPAQHPECATEEATMAPSPFPTSQSVPAQEAGHRPSPSGSVERRRRICR